MDFCAIVFHRPLNLLGPGLICLTASHRWFIDMEMYHKLDDCKPTFRLLTLLRDQVFACRLTCCAQDIFLRAAPLASHPPFASLTVLGSRLGRQTKKKAGLPTDFFLGCGTRTRTWDLMVMSHASCRCSIPRQYQPIYHYACITRCVPCKTVIYSYRTISMIPMKVKPLAPRNRPHQPSPRLSPDA